VLNINAKASQPSRLTIYYNGTAIAYDSAVTQLSAAPTIAAAGTQTMIAEAYSGSAFSRDTVSFLVSGET
ncbi:MAG: hypothetical protein GWN00_18735, partial [Aliifodinibius sp.]|nr:hypothetical protein [Fodinibius sp.]NIV10294.1 hypothetical protein [Fodinibius sp.]NIY26768.1 hypothetical protein [Fodinibius sp.]